MPRKTSLRLKSYIIVSDSIEKAIPFGINRYYKHRDEIEVTDMDAMAQNIYDAIMLELSEVIDWENSA
jgi:hypothetical protein